MSPVLSPDGSRLYVCNRFDHDISVIDTAAGTELRRIAVEREPVAAAMTPDGKTLVVANHLHAGAANTIHAGAKVTLVDTASGKVKHEALGEGTSLMRGVAVSPDGRFAAVTHLRAMYWLSTKAVELGGMNCNALSFVALDRGEYLGTALLDQTKHGAANPWAVAWLADGRTVVVSHAGTHELSLVDAPVDAERSSFTSMRLRAYEDPAAPLPMAPKHPVRLRERVALPGNGPQTLAVAGSVVYVGNYFSGDLAKVDLSRREESGLGLSTGQGESSFRAEALPLGPATPATLVRRGEMLFNDARLCFEGWQSCASCHDADARMDALNWDLLNDGAGNPKNTKSLLRSHETAPAMALGARATAELAVRAGMRHILFTNAPEEASLAIDAWLNSLQPIPGPRLRNGHLSAAAKRGEKLFVGPSSGCALCHPPPLFTDRAAYDVGTARHYQGMWDPAGADRDGEKFDTPSLLELWRTAPYLHDGSAATLREVLKNRNLRDEHGVTSKLTSQELDDLIEFLMSL